jgi:hypothetical protein
MRFTVYPDRLRDGRRGDLGVSTELMTVDRSKVETEWVLLPDGTVRPAINWDDYHFWRAWGHFLPTRWSGVAFSQGTLDGQSFEVSTVFLWHDHDPGANWDWDEDLNPIYPVGYRPLIFETMVFGGPLGGYKRRYRSMAEALAGHDMTVEMAEQPPSRCPSCGGRAFFDPDDEAGLLCKFCDRFADDDPPQDVERIMSDEESEQEPGHTEAGKPG